MLRAERQLLILELIKKHRTLKVGDLSRLLNVSEATVRRDLDRMDREGLLNRTFGGALFAANTTFAFEPSFLERVERNKQQKQQIGHMAASLIKDGDTVILDSGTTTLQIAPHLGSFHDVTVITNDLEIARVLAGFPKINTVLTGGHLLGATAELVGHHAERVLDEVRAAKAFISTVGLTPESGLTHIRLPLVTIKHRMMRAAEQVILVADSSKFGKTASFVVAPLAFVHILVTDQGAPKAMLDTIQRMGIQVLIAPESPSAAAGVNLAGGIPPSL
ncbi:MAG: DeoR/GlpR family DNA-binding transcription regulator [Actinobacteria bacterium]|nr:DeoR/GlpR family DNA-binding transcription regulator [Actinomycetota bacterium]